GGMKGDELPIETRILAVCDVYDALVSDRVYRAAWTPERALALLQEESGTGYDPTAVSALERIVAPTDDGPSWVAGLAAPARPAVRGAAFKRA
ncbi:MAG: HD domain-containing phosphohydrolase, partial [Solirubrobacteraceae bacterium]